MGRPRINDDAQWDQCKERIRTLYINERREFKEVVDIIAREFSFKPRFASRIYAHFKID